MAQQEPQSSEAAHWAAQQVPQLPEGNQWGPQQGAEPLGAEQAELEQQQGKDSNKSSNETTGTVPAEQEPAGGPHLSAELGRDASGHLMPAEAGGGLQLTEDSAAASQGPAPVISAGSTQTCQGQALGEEEELPQVWCMPCIAGP